jgi:transposase
MKVSREEKRVQVMTLKNEGLSNKEISRRTGLSVRGIQKIIKRTKETNSFKEKPRTGRPPKLSEREKRFLVKILKKKEATTASGISKVLKTFHNIQVSRKTVARTLKSFGFSSRIKKKKPKLTEKHKKSRLDWAKKHESWTSEEWKNVIWSDESKFNLLNSDGKEYYWTNRPAEITEDSIKPTLKFGGGGVMVWCCITWKGILLSGKLNILLSFD